MGKIQNRRTFFSQKNAFKRNCLNYSIVIIFDFSLISSFYFRIKRLKQEFMNGFSTLRQLNIYFK